MSNRFFKNSSFYILMVLLSSACSVSINSKLRKAEANEWLDKARRVNPFHPQVIAAEKYMASADELLDAFKEEEARQEFGRVVELSKQVMNETTGPSTIYPEFDPGTGNEKWSKLKEIEETKLEHSNSENQMKPENQKSDVSRPEFDLPEAQKPKSLNTEESPKEMISKNEPKRAIESNKRKEGSQPVKVKKKTRGPSEEKRQVFPEARNIKELKEEGLSTPVTHERRQAQLREGLSFKEKFPGIIAFSFGESRFESLSKDVLKKLLDRLQEEPNSSVMFQAQLAQGEEFGLADLRFDQLKGFLASNGLDESRIDLDEKRTVGDWAEMRIFLMR